MSSHRGELLGERARCVDPFEVDGIVPKTPVLHGPGQVEQAFRADVLKQLLSRCHVEQIGRVPLFTMHGSPLVTADGMDVTVGYAQ
jgi:hypothetical protein